MRWRNTASDYGLIAIILHWLSAIAVFGLFGLGLWMVELSYYDPWYRDAPAIHKSAGILLFVVVALRWIWRRANPRPMPLGKPVEQRLARFVHRSMYVLLFLAMIAGYLIPTAEGRPIDVFGLFEMPATLTNLPRQEDLAGQAHLWLAWALVVLAAGHSLAALKHHFIDRDATLRRIVCTSSRRSHET